MFTLFIIAVVATKYFVYHAFASITAFTLLGIDFHKLCNILKSISSQTLGKISARLFLTALEPLRILRHKGTLSVACRSSSSGHVR